MRRTSLLTPAESAAIDARVAAAEARTGIELVAMVAERASHYPQIPWKAFAFGASMGGAAVFVGDLLRPDWVDAAGVLLPVLALLGCGAALAVATVLASPVARWFLRGPRRDFEARRFAELAFRRLRVDATRGRSGVLVVVCRFERRIEIVADRAFDGCLTTEDWDAALASVTPRPGEGRPGAVLLDAIAAIERLLVAKGVTGDDTGTNELPDRPREDRG